MTQGRSGIAKPYAAPLVPGPKGRRLYFSNAVTS